MPRGGLRSAARTDTERRMPEPTIFIFKVDQVYFMNAQF